MPTGQPANRERQALGHGTRAVDAVGPASCAMRAAAAHAACCIRLSFVVA
ncbi:hypothetical protein [Verminephrobacter eiseniae]|nr:hypothetical protein [Verminephrobacter eiseniae]